MDAMRRRRGPRTTRIGLASIASGVVVLALVFGSGGMGSASFSTGESPRTGSVDVVSDELAAHTLDVAPAVHVDSTDPLVNVTNQLGRDVTVTVQLRSDSTHIGDLVVGGTVEGNETSFALAEGNTRTVAISIENDTTLTSEVVYFHVYASAPGLEVSSPDRSAPVEE